MHLFNLHPLGLIAGDGKGSSDSYARGPPATLLATFSSSLPFSSSNISKRHAAFPERYIDDSFVVATTKISWQA
eukprot:scaffold3719_cov104-Cylindrotheca_fusiformis.AAC.2